MSEDTWVDLASRALGASVLLANDETFAEKENLITAAPPTFTPHTMGLRGQIYDGWETRRRRSPGEDWVIVRLGVPGLVRRVVVDTSFFRGNFPTSCEVHACWLDGWPSAADVADHPDWTSLTGRQELAGDTANVLEVPTPVPATHLRLTIHPDGGVARLRALGEVVPDPRRWSGISVDLAAMENGGVVLDCSDRFYSPPEHAIAPGNAVTMGDGWETRRRRDGGSDWILLGLAAAGRIRQAVIDTTHFVGNAPGAVALTALDPNGEWRPLLPRTALQPDTRHWFGTDAGLDQNLIAHQVRLELIPDGGLARIRLWGDPTPEALGEVSLRWWNALPWRDVLAALDTHPRIGERAEGTGAATSTREQAGVGDDPEIRAALAAGNVEYERRFGHIYLVRAVGRDGAELLALLQSRLGNTPEIEAGIVRRELAEITALRAQRQWGSA